MNIKDICFRGDSLIGPKIIKGLVDLGASHEGLWDGRNSHLVYSVMTIKKKLTITADKIDSPMGKHILSTRTNLTIDNYQNMLDKLTTEPEAPKEERGYRRWTGDEITKLKNLLNEGRTESEISEELGFNINQVRYKRVQLGLKRVSRVSDYKPNDTSTMTPRKVKKLKSDEGIEIPFTPPVIHESVPPITTSLKPLDDSLMNKRLELSAEFIKSQLVLGWDGTPEALVKRSVTLADELLKQLNYAG